MRWSRMAGGGVRQMTMIEGVAVVRELTVRLQALSRPWLSGAVNRDQLTLPHHRQLPVLRLDHLAPLLQAHRPDACCARRWG